MKIIISLIGWVFTCSAVAQDSLSHYLSIAAMNNPDVIQKYREYEATLQKVYQVKGLPDPELNMGVFVSPMELVGGNQVAEIQLMQMFPWFGVLKAAKDEMSMMANAKYELFRDAKLQVIYGVQSTWYNLYEIQQSILISEKNIGILQAIERLSLAKFKTASSETGSGGSLVDLYRIQIEIGDLENYLSLLKNQQNTLVAEFNSYLNRPVINPVSLPDSIPADTLAISLVSVSDSILANNPMLGMLQYEQKSLESRKKMVTKMSYPMIGLGLNYSVINRNEMSTSSMNGKDMVMPMVSVTLPIYRKKYKAMQAETGFLRDAATQNYTASANNLRTEYYQAVQLYQDAQRRVDLYKGQGILAGKSLEITMKSFAASGSGLTDLLRIREQKLEYDYKQIEAIADFNTAIALLKRLGNLETNGNR